MLWVRGGNFKYLTTPAVQYASFPRIGPLDVVKGLPYTVDGTNPTLL